MASVGNCTYPVVNGVRYIGIRAALGWVYLDESHIAEAVWVCRDLVTALSILAGIILLMGGKYGLAWDDTCCIGITERIIHVAVDDLVYLELYLSLVACETANGYLRVIIASKEACVPVITIETSIVVRR